MITESFDESKALIDPEKAINDRIVEIAKNYTIDVFIVVFSYKLIDGLVSEGIIEALDEQLKIGSAAMRSPIYRIKDTNIGVALTGIGAPMAVGTLEELHCLFDCKKFVVYGSSGALKDIEGGRLIVPSEAYRDEGTSYHYVKASDYITIRNADKLAEIFDSLDVEYIKGRIWTIDAFYRETENSRDKRLSDGCLCVDMECSALQAVCDFREMELYQFLYCADSLDGSWSRRILGNLDMDSRLAYFYLARKIAEAV